MSKKAQSTLHQDALHESGYRHTTGEAQYVDDLATPHGTCIGYVVTSTVAHGTISSIDAIQAKGMPGIHCVLFVDDIPGDPFIGPIIHDEPLLAQNTVHYLGQPIGLVVGDSREQCRTAAQTIAIQYDLLPALLTIEEATRAESFLTETHTIARGDVSAALGDAAVSIAGECRNGFQDHFYLETQASLVIPGEDETFHVYSSTQHPTEIQKLVALILGIGAHKVVCEVPRMGGAFGGKESQSSHFACLAALGAHHSGRPVKVWLNRDEDMTITGKRHPFWTRYQAGFNDEGTLTALQVEIYSNGGWSIDLSGPILDRALFHLDNAYFIEHLQFKGRVCRTNLPSNTAFRGFGGPQGMLVVEDAINRYAERTGKDPAEVRAKNFYGPAPRDLAPYGQAITANRLQRIYEELMESSAYNARRIEIKAFNDQHKWVKRGIAFQPVKFGISFTKAILNQAGALILIYTDGTVQLNHGGTEMGQGLHTKMRAVCAHELGLPPDKIRVMHTATDKVPNTSATAASSGSDLNGQAVFNACHILLARMKPIAAELLEIPAASAEELIFDGGTVFHPNAPADTRSFAEVATQCWLSRVSLAATGYYKTPGIHYSHEKGRGNPFYYFAYGASVSEVEVNALTGEHRLLRVDILHDVGASLVPSIDIGQVEGGFVQGVGWLTGEEILYSPEGAILTSGPSTYKIPAMGDIPADFRVQLLDRAPQDGVIHGSKAVGEPPLMLAISVLSALRHAIGALAPEGTEIDLQSPCTPEAILRAIDLVKG
jgi:xanthine dehydrogenase large subunit